MDSDEDRMLVTGSLDSGDDDLLRLAEALNKQMQAAAERLSNAVLRYSEMALAGDDVKYSDSSECSDDLLTKRVHWPRAVYFTAGSRFPDVPRFPTPLSPSKLSTQSCKRTRTPTSRIFVSKVS
jgi:hypothetical protein